MSDLQESRRGPLEQLRNEVIERLTQSFAHDRLKEADFEERLARATGATSRGELVSLVDDLPEPTEPDSLARSSLGEGSGGVRINRGPVKEEGALVAILGGATRKGVWKPPRRLHLVALLGGVELDFTRAEMPPEGTEITIVTLMGGVDILVPEGLNVDCAGIPLLGGFDDSSPGLVNDRPPILKVRGVAFMGGVSVHTRPGHRGLSHP